MRGTTRISYCGLFELATTLCGRLSAQNAFSFFEPNIYTYLCLVYMLTRMMNIKWMDRITNKEVLGRIGERRALWKSSKERRGQMMGHTLRHGGLLRDILEGAWERKWEGEGPD